LNVELVHLTDTHFGCADEAALKAAARYIEEHKPQAVIITGDISKDGLRVEIEAAIAWMRTLAAPVMVTPGNHDVPYYNLWGRIVDPWGRFNRAATGVRTKAWHTPDWSIVPINTARGVQVRLNWAQGAISDHQVKVAAAELQNAAPGALRIIITHHPLDWPNDAPIHGQTINGQKAQHALVAAGAHMFLSGHLHFASARLIQERALSITSGTLSQRVRHEPCAFTAIRRPAPDTIETEIVHVVQGLAQTAAVRRFQLKSDGEVGAPADLAEEAAKLAHNIMAP
jgi:3',5'-cyclic AMP phosphodiesterase CpdA